MRMHLTYSIRATALVVLLIAFVANAFAVTPQSGWWWNPAEGGRGFTIEAQNNTVFIAGYMYDVSGRATWYAAGPAAMSGSTFTSTLTQYGGGQTLNGVYKSVTGTGNVGNVSIVFSDQTHGTMTWPGGAVPIQRYNIVAGGLNAPIPSGTPQAGWWWNPAEGGRGFSLEIQSGTMFLAGYMYDVSGNPIWYASGPTPMSSASIYTGTWQQYGDGQTLGGTYKLAAVVNPNVGNVTVNFSSPTTASMTLPNGATIPLTRYTYGGIIPVQKSSYENKMAAAAAIGPQTLPTNSGDAIAFADFFQDGSYSMVTHTLIYNPQDPTSANKFGGIYFYKNINGTWVDQTSTLLSNSTGCLHPRKAIVADFNEDGKPDVFFACHGFDASPFPGEQQHILLSQTDGTYKNVALPISCYCHGASAADINGDGYPDIAIVDQFVTKTPNFLINNRDGTFTQDLTRLPSSLLYRQIYSTELIDFDGSGKYDLWLSGNEPNATQTPISAQYTQLPTIYKNDGNGRYISTSPVVLPGDPSNGIALDIVFSNGYIYFARTSIWNSSTFYTTVALQKIAYPALTSATIYSHAGAYANGQSWINWIIPYQGNISSLNKGFGVAVSK